MGAAARNLRRNTQKLMDPGGHRGSTRRVQFRYDSAAPRSWTFAPGMKLFLTFGLGILLAAPDGLTAAETARPNVLFIIADDLRAELGCYGKPVKTPNIDALAARGVRFDRAYCQAPLCNPSRTSMLTGRYPHTTGVYANQGNFRQNDPSIVPLPQYFKEHGYRTVSVGKIYHGGNEDPDSWHESAVPPPVKVPPGYNGPRVYSKETSDVLGVITNQNGWHTDVHSVERAINYLQQFNVKPGNEKPFFLAVGFIEPHSPITAPKEFYDLYKAEDLKLPPDFAAKPTVPPGFPPQCIQPNNDLFMGGRVATPEEAREVIRAYYASISWIDRSVGRILAELDRLKMRDRTIVVFWGDNGYHLGEKGKWSKHGSLLEDGARTPLLICDPNSKGNGKACFRIVELVDLYPTLAEVCGLPAPTGVDGVSLKPLLTQPDAVWDRTALTVTGNQLPVHRAIRDERWRYIEYANGGKLLLDEQNDPVETRNQVNNPACAEVVSHLQRQLAAQFKPAKAK